MSFYERYRHPPPLSDLPTWKRLVFFAALGFVVLIGVLAIDKNLTIYGTAPDHPVPDKGQVYPVSVEHGNIRYVTASEKESVELWTQRAGSWAGAAILGAVLLWITSPKKPKSPLQ